MVCKRCCTFKKQEYTVLWKKKKSVNNAFNCVFAKHCFCLHFQACCKSGLLNSSYVYSTKSYNWPDHRNNDSEILSNVVNTLKKIPEYWCHRRYVWRGAQELPSRCLAFAVCIFRWFRAASPDVLVRSWALDSPEASMLLTVFFKHWK